MSYGFWYASGMATNTTDPQALKVRENRLRRMAERQGLLFQKVARRDPRAIDYGTYHLISAYPGRLSWRRLTLDQVEAALNGEAVCPDGGKCHHECPAAIECFRVGSCGPLSGVFPDDEWPPAIRALVKANREPTIEDRLFGSRS
jgi:hypothetical protein